jgi:hypothetical protein
VTGDPLTPLPFQSTAVGLVNASGPLPTLNLTRGLHDGSSTTARAISLEGGIGLVLRILDGSTPGKPGSYPFTIDRWRFNRWPSR